MATTFTNRREAEDHIRNVLDTNPEFGHGVSVEAVADVLHQIAGGSWDILHIDDDIFWATIKKHHVPQKRP